MFWNSAQGFIILRKFPYVTRKDMIRIRRKISPVGFNREPVPFTGKNTFATDILESDPQATNSCKQVNEPKFRFGFFLLICIGN